MFPCNDDSLKSLYSKISKKYCPSAFCSENEVQSNPTFEISGRAQDIRLSITAGKDIGITTGFLSSTKSMDVIGRVGAVKIGYEIRPSDKTPSSSYASPYSYPPTVIPLNTLSNMRDVKPHPLWELNSNYYSKWEHSGGGSIPFTPSCVRTLTKTGRYQDFVYPNDPYTCTEQPQSDRNAILTGTNSFGYQVGLTADRTCVAKNIPLSQCIEYGEESTASANGWVWGLSEGCHFGANSCQATEGNYGTTPKAGVDTTTNFEYTLPPANYPGYNPPKGSYKLDITQFVIGVFFNGIVDDAVRQEVEDWFLGSGSYAENVGVLEKTLQFDLIQNETQEYGWFVFGLGITCFTFVLVLVIMQCINECQEMGGGGGYNSAGDTNSSNHGCCCDHCYWDSRDCSYCFLYNHGGGSRYSSYSHGHSNNCNHVCDGCCNCDCCHDGSSRCDCGSQACDGIDNCCNSCCPTGDSFTFDCASVCGDSCATTCGGCEGCLNGCCTNIGDCGGSMCQACETCAGGGCECLGSCLNGSCECAGQVCEGGCECVGACCQGCGSLDCGACNCNC